MIHFKNLGVCLTALNKLIFLFRNKPANLNHVFVYCNKLLFFLIVPDLEIVS